MTINSIIEQCLQRGHELDWDLDKQNELAAEVVRRLRPDWSEPQIDDAINWVRGYAPGAVADVS